MALKLMYRARYLALVVYGEGHPDMATFDVSNALQSKCWRCWGGVGGRENGLADKGNLIFLILPIFALCYTSRKINQLADM